MERDVEWMEGWRKRIKKKNKVGHKKKIKRKKRGRKKTTKKTNSFLLKSEREKKKVNAIVAIHS